MAKKSDVPFEERKKTNYRNWWYRHHEKNLADLARQRRKPGRRYSNAKAHAKKRGLEFSITIDEYMSVVSKPCNYCNESLGDMSGGLDRIDNDRGYTCGNILPCCRDCNRIRNDCLTVDEMEFVMSCLREYRVRKAAA